MAATPYAPISPSDCSTAAAASSLGPTICLIPSANDVTAVTFCRSKRFFILPNVRLSKATPKAGGGGAGAGQVTELCFSAVSTYGSRAGKGAIASRVEVDRSRILDPSR